MAECYACRVEYWQDRYHERVKNIPPYCKIVCTVSIQIAVYAAVLSGCVAAAGKMGSGNNADSSAATSKDTSTTALRWSGSFMNSSGTSGGQARFVIEQSGRVRGSMTDTVWSQANPTAPPRVATVTGLLGPGDDIGLTVTWTGGAYFSYAGTWSHPTTGSLGANLKATTSKGQSEVDQITLALHEQGIPGAPPYGVAQKTVMPDFQKQWTGTWTVNWYDGGADWGTATVRVTADGTMSGAMVDDGFNSTEWNQAVSATFAGKIGPDGSTTGTVTWSDTRPAWPVTGKAYFVDPEKFQLNFSPASKTATPANSITMTFMRGHG